MFKTMAVIGAGQMGSGIALFCAQAGAHVTVCDMIQLQLDGARDYAQKTLNKALQKGALTADKVKEILNRIDYTLQLNAPGRDPKRFELVIEAASEAENVKFKIFRDISQLLSPKCVIASNTSSLSINRISQEVSHPERFLGVHFMNPAYKMRLVEIISGSKTDPQILTNVEQWLNSIDKQTVRSADHPGFIVNRILIPMVNEAICTLADGVGNTEDIDTALTLGAGFPMGPLRLADLIGLDVCLAIMQTLHQNLKDDKYAPHPLLKEFVNKKRYGYKAGRGFYDYSSGKPMPMPLTD